MAGPAVPAGVAARAAAQTAAQAAGQRLESPADGAELLVKLLLALAGAGLLLVAVAASVLGLGGDGGGWSGPQPGSPVPAGLQHVFVVAGQALDVNAYLLASVAEQESTFGSAASHHVNSAGCVGFMQTCVGGRGGDSWDETIHLTVSPSATIVDHAAYTLATRPTGYSLQTPDHPDYNDPFDAVMAAAALLREKVGGVPIPNLDDTAHRALCGYYGACADPASNYAQTVLARAQQWQADDALGSTSSAPTPGPIASGGLGGAILAAANAQLGVLYQWAGGDRNGPTYGTYESAAIHTHDLGFDCSGLALYAVYQATKATAAPVLLPHDAAAQYASPDVRRVDETELQPGDLVFFDHPIGHVGIYAGGGEMIDAPQTWTSPGVRGHVEYDSITSAYFKTEYAGAARVLAATGANALAAGPELGR